VLAANPGFGDTIPVVTGTVGLLLVAKNRGYIAVVRPLLDELIRQGFWISPALYQTALRQAGEL